MLTQVLTFARLNCGSDTREKAKSHWRAWKDLKNEPESERRLGESCVRKKNESPSGWCERKLQRATKKQRKVRRKNGREIKEESGIGKNIESL